MVEVELWAGLQRFADGCKVVTVEAKNIREMLEALVAKHPDLAPFIEAGVSVAIDGEIHAESVIEPIGPDNEIILMQRLSGG